jgi:hypothetical protein
MPFFSFLFISTSRALTSFGFDQHFSFEKEKKNIWFSRALRLSIDRPKKGKKLNEEI